MTDRELLEAAAKAAGYVHYHPGDGFYQTWNPLTDDGDALRLAVKLGLQSGLTTHQTSLKNRTAKTPTPQPVAQSFALLLKLVNQLTLDIHTSVSTIKS